MNQRKWVTVKEICEDHHLKGGHDESVRLLRSLPGMCVIDGWAKYCGTVHRVLAVILDKMLCWFRELNQNDVPLMYELIYGIDLPALAKTGVSVQMLAGLAEDVELLDNGRLRSTKQPFGSVHYTFPADMTFEQLKQKLIRDRQQQLPRLIQLIQQKPGMPVTVIDREFGYAYQTYLMLPHYSNQYVMDHPEFVVENDKVYHVSWGRMQPSGTPSEPIVTENLGQVAAMPPPQFQLMMPMPGMPMTDMSGGFHYHQRLPYGPTAYTIPIQTGRWKLWWLQSFEVKHNSMGHIWGVRCIVTNRELYSM